MDERECRRVLEVSETASMEEIIEAYQLMKRIYENERSFFSVPSMEEFSDEARAEILEEIEAAFRELSRLHEEAQPQVSSVPITLPEAGRPIDGKALRAMRESAGISLEYISSQTHVRLEQLRALEEERFWDLPPAAVNVRGFLSVYASELGLPVDDVVPPYMERFLRWQSRKAK